MATVRPKRPCAHPGCQAWAMPGGSYCEKHQAEWEARQEAEKAKQQEARKEAAAQSASASAYSSYHTAADAQPSEPAESHHAGFDPGQEMQPAADDPKLEFEPSEGHHTDFTPGA